MHDSTFAHEGTHGSAGGTQAASLDGIAAPTPLGYGRGPGGHMSSDKPPSRRMRDHFITAWILFHLFAVAVQLFPVPPYTSNKALNAPQVQGEIELLGSWMKALGLTHGDPEAVKDDAKTMIRTYKKRVKQLTWFSGAYLAPIGSLQSWNMFGGNNAVAPLVMVVEVLPAGETEFVVFQDGRLGETPLIHRDRKVRRGFQIGTHRAHRVAYADFLGTQWNAQHPSRLAQKVRLYYLPIPVLPPADVRAGRVAKPKKPTNRSTHEVGP